MLNWVWVLAGRRGKGGDSDSWRDQETAISLAFFFCSPLPLPSSPQREDKKDGKRDLPTVETKTWKLANRRHIEEGASPNCPIRFPSAPPPSSALRKNSLVPLRAIVPKFLAISSLDIPIPVSASQRPSIGHPRCSASTGGRRRADQRDAHPL